MIDIFIKKEILSNIEKSKQIEWLERNELGFYSSSTCLGMNTRREHGFFVVPDHSLQKKVVLLSKFEESVFIDNKLHEISTNNYQGGIFPSGYNYINKFTLNPFPKTTFNIDGRILEKTSFLISDKPILVVRYEVKNIGIPVKLIIKPFIADRFSTEVTKELLGLNTDSYQGLKFVRWALKQNMPDVYVHYSSGEFIDADLWYKNFSYPNDIGKYEDSFEEHLFNPGFFQITLNPYQAVDIYVSTENLDLDNLNYEALYRNEREKRKDNKEYFVAENEILRIGNSLKKSLTHKDNNPIISGSSLENTHTTRDIIFSLYGLFFVNKKYEGFKENYLALIDQVQDGLLPVHSPYVRDNNHYSAADLSLWLIELGYDYYKQTNDIEFFKNKVFNTFLAIAESYQKGTLNNIYLDKDDLIFCGKKDLSTSWIPLTTKNGKVVRFGKLLEINALWYNALCIISKLESDLGKKWKSGKFLKQAEKTKEKFLKTFLKKGDKLIDFIVHENINEEFRINQLVVLSLSFSALPEESANKILKNIEKKLLTPYGLKSAAKYRKTEKDEVINRKTSAYYNSAIWPWTIHLYIKAALKLSIDKVGKARILKDYFSPLVHIINSGLINYLPEAILINGEEVMQRGIVDYAPSLSSVLWGFFLLNNKLKLKK